MSVDLEKTLQTRSKADFQDTSFWKPKAGEGQFANNDIRVLPPSEAMDGALFDYRALHWIPNMGPVACPRKVSNGHCPICNEGFRFLKERKTQVSDEQAKQEARKFWPTDSFYVNVVVLNQDGTPAEDRSRVWSMNRDTVDLLIDALKPTPEDLEADPTMKVVNFTDPNEGFNLRVKSKHTKDGQYDKYDHIIVRATKPSAFPYPQLISGAQELTQLNPLPTAEQLENLLTTGSLDEGGSQQEKADPLELEAGQENGASDEPIEAEAKDVTPPAPAVDEFGDPIDPSQNGAAGPEPEKPAPKKRGPKAAAKKDDAGAAEARKAALRAQLNG